MRQKVEQKQRERALQQKQLQLTEKKQEKVSPLRKQWEKPVENPVVMIENIEDTTSTINEGIAFMYIIYKMS